MVPLDDDRAAVDRARPVRGWGVAALVCDLIVALMAWAMQHAFVAAPNGAYSAPADDLRYVLTGLVYDAAAVLRYLVLAALVVALLLHSRTARAGDRRRMWLAAGAVQAGAIASSSAGKRRHHDLVVVLVQDETGLL